jgi:hypothetical protein
MDVCSKTEPGFDSVPGTDSHRAACHLDAEVRRREAEILVTETMASTT